MQNTWLGRRENLLRNSVEPRLDTDTDDRPWNRVQWSGITMAGQPTASNGWRLGLGHGRYDQRQTTTSEQRQQLVRQEEAATRLSHSRRRYGKTSVRQTHSVAPTSTWRRRTWTAARQLVHRQLRSTLNSSGTHTDGNASARTSGNSDSHSNSQDHVRTLSDSLLDLVWQLRQRLSGYCHSPF